MSRMSRKATTPAEFVFVRSAVSEFLSSTTTRSSGSASLRRSSGDDRLEFILSEAADGEAALALIASEDPAVVLLDLNMPRLDGHAVARLVRERRPHVRVIVLTGSDSAEDRRRAEQAGVDAFVEKRQLAETQLSNLIASL
jgi:CheY-like chemotaxis protein